MNERNDTVDSIGIWVVAAFTVAMNFYPYWTLRSVFFAALCLLVLFWRKRSLWLRGTAIACLTCLNWFILIACQLDDQVERGRQTVFKRDG